MKIFNHQFIITKRTGQEILSINLMDKQIIINENKLKDEEILMEKLPSYYRNGIIAILDNSAKLFFIHIKSSVLYCTCYLNNETPGSVKLNIELYSKRFTIKKEKYTYSIVDNSTNKSRLISEELFSTGNTPLSFIKNRKENEPYIYLKISYMNYVSFLEYTINRKEFSIKTIKYELYNNSTDFEINFRSANQFTVLGKELDQIIHINKLVKNKTQILSEEFYETMTSPFMLLINNRLFIINKENNNKLLIYYDKRADLLFHETTYSAKRKKHSFVITGNIDYKFNIPVDTLVTKKGEFLGSINWKNNRQFEVVIKEESLNKLINIHNSIWFAIEDKLVHSMYRHSTKEPKVVVEDSFTNGDRAYVIRLNKKYSYTLSILPALPIYNNFNKVKINLAEFISKQFPNLFNKKKINLYFEKEASQASESAKSVFKKVIKNYNTTTINKFILDKSSKDYYEMKKKYKENIISRFSFKHYLYIFYANTYISSELSNHVIASRVFTDKINEQIVRTPLYFLQHGIMFAKPVDNPMALGFHKENVNFNLIKSVISSDLEAKEFYKMGYEKKDLMKTGLPKMDNEIISSKANKITYMPTWRYWEEAYIINDEIERTTYFQSLMNMIRIFERAGLIDRLLISPHNKFSTYIYEHMREYKHLICEDPSVALNISQAFITDYSSVIYDSIYQGGYPIFYWKDSNYLIENYKAIPPVNEDNAPGVVAKTDDELINAVKNAIENEFKISENIVEKYRDINEFHDNKNTERVIEELIKDSII